MDFVCHRFGYGPVWLKGPRASDMRGPSATLNGRGTLSKAVCNKKTISLLY